MQLTYPGRVVDAYAALREAAFGDGPIGKI